MHCCAGLERPSKPALAADARGSAQICKAGLTHTRKIWLTRHGESEYNTRDLLGGNSSLSPKGQAYAKQLPDIIVDRIPLVRSLDRVCD